MFFTHPVLKRPPTYVRTFCYSEFMPQSLKNRVEIKPQRGVANSCTQELQALFGCLKKWEFDDLPCTKQHSAYMDCVRTSAKAAAAYREASQKGTLGESQDGKSITAAQFNKIMKLFPQPNLGQSPYRRMQRWPSMNYADDIYRRQDKKGKPS